MPRSSHQQPGDLAAIQRLAADMFGDYVQRQKSAVVPPEQGKQKPQYTRLDLSSQINTVRNPLRIQNPAIHQWQSWFSHGIKHGMNEIDWSRINWAKDTRPEAAMPVEHHTQSTVIACDVELARLAVGLKQAPLFRLWVILLKTARESSGKNYVFRADLPELLITYGVKFSTSNLNRWLRLGQGLYWIVTPSGRVRFTGYAALSKALVEYALAQGLPDLVSTNRPGDRRYMYIDVAGDHLIDFEANVRAAWLASKNNPTIARSTESKLWNRDARALREWGKHDQVKNLENRGQYHWHYFDALPQDEEGNLREDVREVPANGTVHWRAQMSNTYIAPAIKQHDKRGQSRRVAREVKAMLATGNPAGTYGQEDDFKSSSGGLEPTGRMYFSDPKRAQSSAKRTGERSRFIPLGNRKKTHIWDYAPDGKRHTDLPSPRRAKHA